MATKFTDQHDILTAVEATTAQKVNLNIGGVPIKENRAFITSENLYDPLKVTDTVLVEIETSETHDPMVMATVVSVSEVNGHIFGYTLQSEVNGKFYQILGANINPKMIKKVLDEGEVIMPFPTQHYLFASTCIEINSDQLK